MAKPIMADGAAFRNYLRLFIAISPGPFFHGIALARTYFKTISAIYAFRFIDLRLMRIEDVYRKRIRRTYPHTCSAAAAKVIVNHS
jgi:hypothetical protein